MTIVERSGDELGSNARPEGAPAPSRLWLPGGAMAAVVVVGLIGIVLAPRLGELVAPPPIELWPEIEANPYRILIVNPEPEELVRFAAAALVPIAVAVLVLVGSSSERRRGSLALDTALGAAVGLMALVGAVGILTRSEPNSYGLYADYFSWAALAAAVLLALLLVGAALSPRTRSWLQERLPPRATAARRPWTFVGRAGVVLLTALFIVPSVYTDANLRDGPSSTVDHLPFTFADFAAFGNGLTPLVDFAAQYTQVLPWLLHPVLAATSYGPGSFTVVMGVLTAITMLALWRALALATGSEWVGAVLYVPLLAVSLRPTIVIGDERVSNGSLFQILPERYLAVAIVGWLCVRHARGLRPHSTFVVLLVAVLALLNNPEFGAPCLLATLLALVVSDASPPLRAAIRLAPRLVAALALAGLSLSLATVVRTGQLPNPALLTYFSRLFAAQGFGLEPMPNVGFHLVLYVTFVTALLAGVVRRATTTSDRALPTLLVFAGTFSLTAASYYVGRSNAVTLVAMFPAWGLCVAALSWPAFRWLLSRDRRRDLLTARGALAVCVLVALGLMATDLREAPNPITQARRLSDTSAIGANNGIDAAAEFVADRTQPGEAVIVLRQHGHLVAERADVRNVAFIGHPLHVIAPSQLDEMLDDLLDAGGDAVFVGTIPHAPNDVRALLRTRGWTMVSAEKAPVALEEWQRVDSVDADD